MVANRASGANQAMSLAEFQKALGKKVDFQIPDDPKAFKDAANAGKPVVQNAPRSKSAKVLRQIANQVVTVESAAGKARKGIWTRLAKRG